MKRPYTAIMKTEEESADSISTAAPTTQVFLDENNTFLSSFNNGNNDNNDNNDGSDSEDGLSDSSKKMRKKRNAYQKISDEIRVNLLDAVKNGETLKAAAKRYKINYSSAKSILHTYRKEGRILKKSAQERTTKKKSPGLEPSKAPLKSSKSKKESSVVDENSFQQPKPLENISKKVKTSAFVNNTAVDEVQPLTQANKNKANLPNEYNLDNSGNCKTVPVITVTHKSEDANEHDHNQEHNFLGGLSSRPASRKGSMHQFKMFDNYPTYNSHMDFPDFSHMMGDNYDFVSYRRFSQDFASLNDGVHSFLPKSGQNEEHFQDPNFFFGSKGHQAHTGEDHKLGKVENFFDYDDHVDGNHASAKGLMESQRLFRNNLRKASFLSFGSNSGYRKGSFDMF